MIEHTDIPIHHNDPDLIGASDSPDHTCPRGPKVFVAKVQPVPVRHFTNAPPLDGRICILDNDLPSAVDLAEVLEAMGHEVLIINEIIGASNRIRAFCPEVLVIDAAGAALPGPKLLEVLRHNLGDLPGIIFFTDMPEAELRRIGLGDHEWHPKSRGLLTLVNRILVMLMRGRSDRTDD